MPKRIYINGVGKIVGNNQIPKYPPRPSQRDFPPVIPEDKFHSNLIRVNSECPFSKPKSATAPGNLRATVRPTRSRISRFGNARQFGGKITATNIPTRFQRQRIMKTATQFSKPMFAGLIRVD